MRQYAPSLEPSKSLLGSHTRNRQGRLHLHHATDLPCHSSSQCQGANQSSCQTARKAHTAIGQLLPRLSMQRLHLVTEWGFCLA